MDKRKTALTIGKLFGTAIALTLVLVSQLLIEGLEASLKFGRWAMDKLNQPVMQIESQPEIKAIGPAKMITAVPKIEAIGPTEINAIADELKLPIRFPVNSYLWMINELPREYLNVKSLKVWAKDRKVRNYSKMIKAELVKVLSHA